MRPKATQRQEKRIEKKKALAMCVPIVKEIKAGLVPPRHLHINKAQNNKHFNLQLNVRPSFLGRAHPPERSQATLESKNKCQRDSSQLKKNGVIAITVLPRRNSSLSRGFIQYDMFIIDD